MQGWIKIHRSLLEWEWFKKPEMLQLWIYLLLKANHKEKKWEGVTVKRGQLITGRKKIAEETGLSEGVVRGCLKKMEKSKNISIKSTSQYSIITICNYDIYQSGEKKINQRLTNKQPAVNQQLTTNKNEKKIKMKKYNNNLIDFFKEIISFFPEKFQPNDKKTQHKWLETLYILSEKEKYSFAEIREIIRHFRRDAFWQKIFLTLPKLLQKNKEGIKYIHYFAEILKNSARNSTKITQVREKNILNNKNRLKF